MILDQMNGPTVGHFNVDYAPGSDWRIRRFYIDTVSGVHDIFFKFKDNIPNDLQKANQQVEIIKEQIKATIHPEQRHRLGLLWHRLTATRDHILLNQQFPDITWKELPSAFASWVEHFTHRVTDISSLGNIISVQNRFIQQRYLSKVISLRQEQHIRPPADLVAKGTRTGAIITWKNQQQGATGFYVYRDNKKLNNIPLSPDIRYYVDINDKDCMYTVSVLNRFGLESKPSIPARCHAGQSDNHPPFLVLISPPGSMPQDQDASVKIRVLDNRVDSLIHAKLYTRTLGTTHWTEQSMDRKTKAIFTAEIAADVLINKGAEYYVRVTDGDNLSFFPASGPDRPLSIIVYPVKDDEAPPLPANFSVQHQTLTWSPASTDVYGYQIYRDREKDFKPGLNTLLTYTCKNTFRFQDKEPDFDGKALKGRYYYKIIAVDKTGNKSPSSVAIGIEYSSF
jgi:hypothetical protein